MIKDENVVVMSPGVTAFHDGGSKEIDLYHLVVTPDAHLAEELTNLGDVKFQTGAVESEGVNGVTESILLEVLMHRLRAKRDVAKKLAETQDCPNARSFSCALISLEKALKWIELAEMGDDNES